MIIALSGRVVRLWNAAAKRNEEKKMNNLEGIKEVFQITEREGKKSLWTRVGSAFVNRDKSLNVILSCLPIDGRLHIRDPRSKKKGEEDE